MGMAAVLSSSVAAPRPLLVDRDEDTRRMYAQFLKASNCDIDEAGDGRQALAKALARQPDVLITETRLPGMNGFELCSLLRSDPSTKFVPIVFVTGDAFDHAIKQAQDAGADAVLVKPCLPQTLFLEVRRLLQQSPELRERARIARVKVVAKTRRPNDSLDRPTTDRRRPTLSRAHVRQQTTTPPLTPPLLFCPACDKPLTYLRSHIGGVNAQASEQWDYYDCPAGCGSFQYRQRTRKLRRDN